MYYFNCDYTQGAHPKILERMVQTNLEHSVGYGLDPHCERARKLIREACGAPAAGVHFLVGGTQANVTVIRHALRPHQGAVAAATGHINVHETGAVEGTGHKVLPLEPDAFGRISAEQIRGLCAAHYDPEMPIEHTVQPGLVYLSQPTECGGLYSLEMLTGIREVCDQYGMKLFVDGARLGYALGSPENDVTLKDLARLCHAFYIGGTKCGAWLGEAVVISDAELDRDFRYAIKQNTGMLAKGRLRGIQFEVLFEDGLYEAICRQAVAQAREINAAFREAGYREYAPSPTNQQFFVLPEDVYRRLSEEFVLEIWAKLPDGELAVRVCTSWGTTREEVEALCRAVSRERP